MTLERMQPVRQRQSRIKEVILMGANLRERVIRVAKTAARLAKQFQLPRERGKQENLPQTSRFNGMPGQAFACPAAQRPEAAIQTPRTNTVSIRVNFESTRVGCALPASKLLVAARQGLR